MNTPVSFEIAKLLKEKGFDIPCWSYYSSLNLYTFELRDWNNHTIGDTSMHKRNAGYYSAPTIAEVVCWIYGRSHTEESKLLIKEQRSIPILQYDLEMNFIKEWDSMRDAANELGIYESGINACVNGKQKFSKGFIWKRKENPVDYIQKSKKVYMGKPLQVNQYNLEGILIKTWVSISEASKQTKTSKSSIIRCCKNKQKTANNFI